MKLTSVVGAAEIKAKLKAAGIKSSAEIFTGLKRAGLLLQRLSQKVVPVQYGNLKNSAGTRAIGYGRHASVAVFYTAAYAVYVHERTELRHKTGKQAKFLEEPARKHKAQLLAVIAGRKTGEL